MTVTVLSLIILLTLWALTTQLRAWWQTRPPRIARVTYRVGHQPGGTR